MKRLFVMRHDNPQRLVIADRAIAELLERVGVGQDIEIEIREPRRTLAENALLHALITEMAAQLEWAGKKRDVETWKRLLVAAWMRAEGKTIEILPALDGHGMELIPVRTSGLGKRACADLIEFIYAWGAEQGIRWAAHDRSAA